MFTLVYTDWLFKPKWQYLEFPEVGHISMPLRCLEILVCSMVRISCMWIRIRIINRKKKREN